MPKHKFDQVRIGDIFIINSKYFACAYGDKHGNIIIATSDVDSSMTACFSCRYLKDGTVGGVFRHLYRYVNFVGREDDPKGEMVRILFT